MLMAILIFLHLVMMKKLKVLLLLVMEYSLSIISVMKVLDIQLLSRQPVIS